MDEAAGKLKIGLALSGGGFRASLFHLGVIRRLEELGIMPDVAVVSSVSGGSIIAAYYLVEMERKLRTLTTDERASTAKRVQMFEEIAAAFIQALDHNLRTRAVIFTPFHHPWLFVKTLFLKAFRTGARAELIQAEYDKWFYNNDTLDQLPSVTPDGAVASKLMGPKLVINTTSLLTGEGVRFSREPNTGIKDLRTPDRNFIPLSKAVGASSGVPVVFPPTAIRGDLLVDGGVADNQGIEGLRENACDFYLVSDASGQMEALDSMRTNEAAVYGRVSEIFQFQIRNKLLSSLVDMKVPFAFVHLYLNLKDWEATQGRSIPRVTSQVIPALARIRTDLDQFSPIERETLMYHGYTLIDAVIEKYCPELTTKYGSAKMSVPHLFANGTMKPEDRKVIRADLEAGRQSVFLLRSLKKYPRLVSPTYAIGLVFWVASAVALLLARYPMERVSGWIGDSIDALIPAVVENSVNVLLTRLLQVELRVIWEGASAILAFFIVCAVPLYIALFWVFGSTRQIARSRDLQEYRKIANTEPTLHWQTEDTPEPPQPPLQKRAVAGDSG